jgi:membrane-associated phospholipid phosphatase
LIIDWIPLALILVGYDVVRAFVANRSAAHVNPQLIFDKIIGFGQVPTIRLQSALYFHRGFPHWWDWALFGIYVSHFFVGQVTAALIWRFDYANFRRFALMFLLLTFAALLTFALYPTVPPWMAAKQELLPVAPRIVKLMFRYTDFHVMGAILGTRMNIANTVAAVPSLHAAWPFLIMLFFWSRAGWWRIAMVGYVGFMAISLIYGAEHYAFDILLGWLYATVAFMFVEKMYRRKLEIVKPEELAAA